MTKARDAARVRMSVVPHAGVAASRWTGAAACHGRGLPRRPLPTRRAHPRASITLTLGARTQPSTLGTDERTPGGMTGCVIQLPTGGQKN